LAQTLVTSLIGLRVLMKSRPDRSVIDNSVSIIVSLVK
ncbi:TetR/AcrR family transcriptional regulator, partial [Bacillus thuringiensis]